MNHSFDKDAQIQILYEIITLSSKKVDNLYDKLLEYLQLIEEVSSFEHGFISHINNGTYTILQNNLSTSPSKWNLCDTLCQEIIHQGTTIIHGQLKDTPFYDLAVSVSLEAEAAIGTPIFINHQIVAP